MSTKNAILCILTTFILLGNESRLFGDDVNISPPGGDYLIDRKITISADTPIDPDPEGFCGCDSENTPFDWVYYSSWVTFSGDMDGDKVETSTTGQKNIYAHVEYNWSCEADNSTKTTQGNDDAQASFNVYNVGLDGPYEMYVDSPATFDALEMPHSIPKEGFWQAQNGLPSTKSDSSTFTTKWTSPGEHGISITVDGRQYIRTVKVKPPEITITSVTFVSDHGVITDNDYSWEPCGNMASGPEWTPQKTFPITHTMGKTTKALLKVSIMPTTISQRSYNITGDGPPGLNFIKQASLAGGQNQIVEVDSTDTFAWKIHKVEAPIFWTIEANDFGGSVQTGPHKVYVLFDKPIQNVNSAGMLREECVATEKRIATAVSFCDQYGSRSECAWKLWSSMGWMNYYSNDPLGPDNIWKLYDGVTSQCPGLARFLNAHMMMLGFEGELRFSKPKADGAFAAEPNMNADVRLVSATAGHPSGTSHGATTQGREGLRCFDATNYPNSFEAAILFETVLYAPAVTYTNSARTLVEAISTYGIHWCYDSMPQKCPHVPWVAKP